MNRMWFPDNWKEQLCRLFCYNCVEMKIAERVEIDHCIKLNSLLLVWCAQRVFALKQRRKKQNKNDEHWSQQMHRTHKPWNLYSDKIGPQFRFLFSIYSKNLHCKSISCQIYFSIPFLIIVYFRFVCISTRHTHSHSNEPYAPISKSTPRNALCLSIYSLFVRCKVFRK